MRIENCIIITKDDSIIEMTHEEKRGLKGNIVIHEKQLKSEIDNPEAWGILLDTDTAAAE